jgi:hypothetical protein
MWTDHSRCLTLPQFGDIRVWELFTVHYSLCKLFVQLCAKNMSVILSDYEFSSRRICPHMSVKGTRVQPFKWWVNSRAVGLCLSLTLSEQCRPKKNTVNWMGRSLSLSYVTAKGEGLGPQACQNWNNFSILTFVCMYIFYISVCKPVLTGHAEA